MKNGFESHDGCMSLVDVTVVSGLIQCFSTLGDHLRVHKYLPQEFGGLGMFWSAASKNLYRLVVPVGLETALLSSVGRSVVVADARLLCACRHIRL